MKTRVDVLKHLINRFGYTSYLEIGIQYGHCWTQIECPNKVGVEPNPYPDENVIQATSDQFFENNKDTFDLIFIDGDHSYHQAIKDIRNAIKILNPGGTIVCHDTYPPDENHTNPFQCGEVYKAIAEIRSEGGFKFCTFNEDFGVCSFQRDESVEPMDVMGVSYQQYMEKAQDILNLQNGEGFMKHYE